MGTSQSRPPLRRFLSVVLIVGIVVAAVLLWREGGFPMPGNASLGPGSLGGASPSARAPSTRAQSPAPARVPAAPATVPSTVPSTASTAGAPAPSIPSAIVPVTENPTPVATAPPTATSAQAPTAAPAGAGAGTATASPSDTASQAPQPPATPTAALSPRPGVSAAPLPGAGAGITVRALPGVDAPSGVGALSPGAGADPGRSTTSPSAPTTPARDVPAPTLALGPAPPAPPAPALPATALPAVGGAAPTTPTSPPSIDSEARAYVSDISSPGPRPVEADRADHFVTRDQIISLLPEVSAEVVTRGELARDPALAANSPITVVREVEQIEITSPEKLIAGAAGNLEQPVRLLEQDSVRQFTLRQVLERYAGAPKRPLEVVRNVRYFEVTTPAALQMRPETSPDEELSIIRAPYRLESATIADLLRAKLGDVDPDAIFYVRTVQPNDEQGIWGIIHDGIIENFARGIAIRRGEQIDTYQVEIPRDADERLADRSSSFLGLLIHDKARESWVYNYRNGRMGQNPNRVYPGQEIVIVSFSPEELSSIYRHFVGPRG